MKQLFFFLRQNGILNSSFTVFAFLLASCVIMMIIVSGFCSRYDAVMSEPFVLQHERPHLRSETQHRIFILQLKKCFGLEFVLDS